MNHSRSTPLKHASSSTLFLQSKIKPYKDRYSSSTKKLESKTPWINLISKVYDQPPQMPNFKTNSKFRAKTANKDRQSRSINPQIYQNQDQKTQQKSFKQKPLIKDLGMTASQISSYAGLNQKLLNNKKQLTDHIISLKQKIKQQTKKLHDVNYNNKVCINSIQNQAKFYNEAHQKHLVLNNQIIKTQINVKDLTSQNIKFQKMKADNNKQISKLTKMTDHLQNTQNANLKVALLIQDSKRLKVKKDLETDLKKMDNLVIYQKQLQVEREQIFSEINKSVKENQI